MAFFKFNEETNEIDESDHVSGVGFDLCEESKGEYTYPAEGWFYAENLDAAKELLNAAAAR